MARHLTLLDLPNELLLHVFRNLQTVSEALALSVACTRLNRLFKDGRNKINILQSVAVVPKNPDYDVESMLSVIVRVSPSELLLRGKKGYFYSLRVDYSEFSHQDVCNYTVRDLQTIHSCAENPEFGFILREFIAQFHDTDCRWNNYFADFTSEILSKAADLQGDILDRSTITSPTLFNNDLLIALALNCLTILIDIWFVDSNWPFGKRIHGFRRIVLSEAGHNGDYGLKPLIEVQKIRDKNSPTVVDSDSDIESPMAVMLDHLTRLSREMLLKRDPRNWPTILYVLCIFNIVAGAFTPLADWMQPLKTTAETLRLMLSDLCRLYYICTDGGQPFTEYWDPDAYEAMVEGDNTAMYHWECLHEMWLEASYSSEIERNRSYRDITGFINKVDAVTDHV